MKNLKLYSEFALNLELLSEEESPLLFAIDIERNRLFFASSAGVLYFIHPNLAQKGKQWLKNSAYLREAMIDLEPGDSIQALDYLMEKEALIIGTTNGYLLLYNVDDGTSEAVGKVEGGVCSIAPSPDGALLVVTAGFGQILVMTQDWEVLYENNIESCEFEATDSSDLSGSSNLLQTHICWRGDGKYFASLSKSYNSSSQKKLKIWERETGTLHASSEFKSFMEATLDWMPSGAKVVASYDRKADNKCPLIVFFERNGLERSSFSIDEPVETSVEILKWNCSSDLLAALVSFDENDAIKIWSFSNNRWYLKQEMKFPKKDRVKFIWEPTKPFQMICWTLSGRIVTYNFVWVTAVTDDSTAFVIDNGKILVSPLAISLIPPPLSLFNLKCASAVQDLAFLRKNSKPLLALGLSDGSLSVVELPELDTWEELEDKELCIERCQSDITIGELRHLTWLDSHTLLGVSQREASQGIFLVEIELVCSENSEPGIITSSGWHTKIANSEFIENSVICIVPNPTKKGVAFVQFDGGCVFEYASKMSIKDGSAGPYLLKLDFEFSSSCPWMNAISVVENETQKTLVFGLDDCGRLQVNGKILCHNCSSFSFYSTTEGIKTLAITHLIVTTKQDHMFIIGVQDILNGNAEMKFDNYVSGNAKKRQDSGNSINIWERGAKLVGVIHGDEASVVLQTNRGNIECIYPRKLVLDSIITALVQRRFKDAISMVRRHRIDFNVIVDHCGWKSFLQLVPEFVLQVNNLSHITDFICSLRNENVMQTLYKNIRLPCSESHKSGADDDVAHSEGKVSSVLHAIKAAVEVEIPPSPSRELCILTSLARSDPPALEEALKRIKSIREKELLGTDDTWRSSYPTAEDSVKHLLWLSDPEAVYEAALGLYDLNLAGIVALNSQKDPKEFIPFLQGLDRMQSLMMKYTIDLKLHRYENALKHIVLAGEAYYQDCINLIKNKPQLFPLGIQLFQDVHKKHEVLESWGDYLYEQKSFEDAATNYLCCSSLTKAMKAYRASGNWRSVFSLAGILNLERKEVLQLANEICEELNALGKPAEAARVALEYCADVAGAVGYFMSAREWEEALRVALMHARKDLVSEVKVSSLESMSTLVCEFEEGKEKIGKYLARYLAVRQRRLLLKAKLELEDRSLNDMDDDNASETSSNFSGMSAYTKGTNKGSGASVSSSTLSKTRDRRRQRKKGGKIRAGSPDEEMALVDHLLGMAITSGVQRELYSLIRVLVMFGEEASARKLQLAGDSFQVSQLAAVKLTEDTISNEVMDDNTQNLTHYIKKVKCELPKHEAFSWQSKVLLPL